MHILCGNDIVDIKNTDNIKSFSNPSYLLKVFNESELIYLKNIQNPLSNSFIFWACKEATYKVCFKKSNIAFSFIPKQLTVRKDPKINNDTIFWVVYYGNEHKNFVKITDKFVHVCCLENSEVSHEKYFFHSNVIFDNNAQLINNHDESRKIINEELSFMGNNIRIVDKKINGLILPALSINNVIQKNMDISISHDGNWLAYCVIINKEILRNTSL